MGHTELQGVQKDERRAPGAGRKKKNINRAEVIEHLLFIHQAVVERFIHIRPVHLIKSKKQDFSPSVSSVEMETHKG